MNPKAYHWIPINTSTVFATDNSGPWYKNAYWAQQIDPLPMEQRAKVIKEILQAIAEKRPYTHLRPATPFEDMGQQRCMALVGVDVKKPGDMLLCNGTVTHTRYWVEHNSFMGRIGFCAKHVAEGHGSDPMRMHAVNQSKPVVGNAGKGKKNG